MSSLYHGFMDSFLHEFINHEFLLRDSDGGSSASPLGAGHVLHTSCTLPHYKVYTSPISLKKVVRKIDSLKKSGKCTPCNGEACRKCAGRAQHLMGKLNFPHQNLVRENHEIMKE